MIQMISEKTKTVFQSEVKREDMVYLTRLLHPQLTKEQIDKHIKLSYRYTWVCVDVRIPGYGNVSFAVDNHSQKNFSLWGPRVSKKQMSDAITNKLIVFKVWRFSTDKLSVKNSDRKTGDYSIALAEMYMVKRYKLPSVDEFYKVYYED